ncbi:MAG: acylglycerol kinase family protein [Fimbriimonadaceae bacterium]
MKVAVIRNPHSGRGAGARSWPEIEARLRESLGELLVSIESTRAAGSGAEQARELADSGIEIIVAVGGDGTISDVMQGVVHTESALAIIPLGTGNDFSRTLGIGTDCGRAIEAIKAAQIQNIDVGPLAARGYLRLLPEHCGVWF